MSAPVITGITFDKPSYRPGEIITASVAYGAGTSGHSFTGTATDTVTGETGTLTVTFATTDPVKVSVSDDGGRTWVQRSDDGAVAVFTAVA